MQGKYAIALCVLLAACGAQGSLFSTIMEQIISGIQKYTTIAQEQLEATESLVDEAIERANSMADTITNDFETVINTYNEDIAVYFENADKVDLDSCIELSSTFRETATERATEMKTCFTNNLSTMKSRYHQTVTSFEEILRDMSQLEKDAEACADSGIFTEIMCITKVSATMAGSIAENVENLVANSTSIIDGFSNVSEMVAACSAASAIASVNLEAVDSAIQVGECVAELAMGSAPSLPIDISDIRIP